MHYYNLYYFMRNMWMFISIVSMINEPFYEPYCTLCDDQHVGMMIRLRLGKCIDRSAYITVQRIRMCEANRQLFPAPSHKAFSPEGETWKPSIDVSRSKHADGNKSVITPHAVISLRFIFHLNLWATAQLWSELNPPLTGEMLFLQVSI